MIGGRSKNRVQIKRVDSQILQIIQVIDHAVQVSTLKTLLGRRAAPGFEANAARVWCARAASKTVGKDLVKDGMFYPGGCLNKHRFSIEVR